MLPETVNGDGERDQELCYATLRVRGAARAYFIGIYRV